MLFRRTHIFAHRSSVLDIDFMTPLLAVGALVGIYTTFASAVGKLPLMRMGKGFFWLFFIIVTIWETASFALAIINRSKSIETCEQANPSSNATDSTSSNATTNGFLGMNLGNTYGLANCSQAVQAGVIGIAVMLFAGTLFMFYFATVVSSYCTRLRERNLGHRLRDHSDWDESVTDLSAAYRADAQSAPRYQMKPLNKQKKNKFGFSKFKFGRK
ncbi:54S ribosomal protein L2 mitochondrial [Umbelopsis nana]